MSEYKKPLSVKTTKLGYSTKDAVYFEVEDGIRIDRERAMEIQTAEGYNPMGYGFENFSVKMDPVLHRYKATWKCQASCD